MTASLLSPLRERDSLRAARRSIRLGGAPFRRRVRDLVLMTGAGLHVSARHCGGAVYAERFTEALRSVTIVSRGPKPHGRAERDGGLRPDHGAGAQHLARNRAGDCRPAGAADRDSGVRPGEPEICCCSPGSGRGGTAISIYRWALPDDLAPLHGGGSPDRGTASAMWCCLRLRSN